MLDRLRQPVSLPFARSGNKAAAAEPSAVPFSADADDHDAVPPPSEGDRVVARGRAGRAPRRRGLGRESAVVGLALEPGLLVAAKSHVNGALVVENAAFASIHLDVMRDGEVHDVPALADALSGMFKGSRLERRVRIGIANQRIMMRRLELPPLTDQAEINQAVMFQAQDEIPMPLDTVVLDYHSLGVIEGPNGPRLEVLLVAARRDMIERVMQAAQLAGLQLEGVDLAAFGMIRALRAGGTAADEQVMYLAIGGLTNIAIARGAVCEFTRVVPWGVEQIAGDVASRCAIPLNEARRLLIETHAESAAPAVTSLEPPPPSTIVPSAAVDGISAFSAPAPPLGFVERDPDDLLQGPPPPAASDPAEVARTALSEGIRRIASEVRNSLDFYLAGQGDGSLTRAVLCGPALEIDGFADALSRELGIEVTPGSVALATDGAAHDVPLSVLPVAAGLSVIEGAP
jgi:type IV pilus assembly protein PilM